MAEATAQRTAVPRPLIELTEDEVLFRDSVRQFANDAVRPLSKEMDEKAVFDHGILEEYVRCGVDGVFFFDDWGTQRGPMISMEIYREFYRPLHSELEAFPGMLELLEQLDAEPRSATVGSIRGTLLHLVGAQRGYLSLLTLPIEARPHAPLAFAELIGGLAKHDQRQHDPDHDPLVEVRGKDQCADKRDDGNDAVDPLGFPCMHEAGYVQQADDGHHDDCRQD